MSYRSIRQIRTTPTYVVSEPNEYWHVSDVELSSPINVTRYSRSARHNSPGIYTT